MKAYMVQSKKAIEPLGEHPRECLILNRKLSELQEDALRRQGVEVEATADASRVKDSREHLLFDDCLFFTPELLREFIDRSRKLRGPTVCALKPGITTLRTVVATQEVSIHPDRVEFGLHYVPEEGQAGPLHPVVIEPDQDYEFVPFPEHVFGVREYRIPLTARVIVVVSHWTNLWAANIGALLAEGGRLKRAPIARLLGLALRARSLNRWKILRQTNRIGRNCDIHPAAYVEGSTIGDNVRIGAGSVIRESLVGDGAYIADNATVVLSIIGERCTIMNGCTIQYCVLYPGTFSNARFMDVSLCGRDTFVGDGVTFTDFRFDGRTVRVLKDGAVVDTENTFIGCCLGHGVYVGSGCVLASGRAIPNGWRIVPEKDRVMSGCGPDQGVPGYRVVRMDEGR